jgi:hypothetical protein
MYAWWSGKFALTLSLSLSRLLKFKPWELRPPFKTILFSWIHQIDIDIYRGCVFKIICEKDLVLVDKEAVLR